MAHDSDSGKIRNVPIASNVVDAAVSPNHRFLIYCSAGATYLRNLQEGDVKRLFSQPTHAFEWSPDGSRFSYKGPHNTLYVSDISGRTQFVCGATGAPYREFISPVPPDHKSSIVEITTELSRGVWIADDKLVFCRFTGEMPNILHSGDTRCNTTTVATLHQRWNLMDYPYTVVNVYDVCARKSLFLISDTSGQYVAGPLTDLKSKHEWRRLPSTMEFMPACTLYYISGKQGEQLFRFVDPETLQERSGPTIGWAFWHGSPVFDSEGKLIALPWHDEKREYISIIDISTEKRRKIYKASPKGVTEMKDPRLIAWLSD
ncbi:hypothetical protein L0222_32290 [bacterium]|nr:hypothetical protein [bacterium]